MRSFTQFRSDLAIAEMAKVEDFLCSAIDDKEISAVVGSLESSLASPSVKDNVQQNLARSITNNHVNHTASGNGPANHILRINSSTVSNTSDTVSMPIAISSNAALHANMNKNNLYTSVGQKSVANNGSIVNMSHVTANSTSVINSSIASPNTSVVMTVPGSTNVGTVVVGANVNGRTVNNHTVPMTVVRTTNTVPTVGTNSPGAGTHLTLVNSGQLIAQSQQQYVIKPEHQIRTPMVKQEVKSSPHALMVNSSVPGKSTAVNVVRPASAAQFQILNVNNTSRLPTTQAATPTTQKVLAPRGVNNTPIRIAPQQSQVAQRPQASIVSRNKFC